MKIYLGILFLFFSASASATDVEGIMRSDVYNLIQDGQDDLAIMYIKDMKSIDSTDDWTLLMQASKYGRLKIVEYLVDDKKVDVNIVESKMQVTALDVANEMLIKLSSKDKRLSVKELENMGFKNIDITEDYSKYQSIEVYREIAAYLQKKMQKVPVRF